MLNRPYDPTALRQRLAAQGVHFDREPSDFPASADVLGITPQELGFHACGFALNELRRLAKERLGRDYAIQALRAPRTGLRLGYTVYAAKQVDADAIRDRVQTIVDHARVRAGE